MLKKTYETERLVLYLSESGLAAKVADFYVKNRDFFEDIDPVREKTYYTEEFQRRALARDLRNARELSAVRLWLLPKDDPENGDIIGMAALSNIVFGPFCSAFLTYKLDKNHTGRGLMQEAVKELIHIAFEDVGLHRLEANIMPRNAPSLKLVERLGFRNEGLAEKYLKIGGVWEDHIHMVLLNEKA